MIDKLAMSKSQGHGDLLAQCRPICCRHSILTSLYRTLMLPYYCAVWRGDSGYLALLRRLCREHCERRLGQASVIRNHLRQCEFRWAVAGSTTGSRSQFHLCFCPQASRHVMGSFTPHRHYLRPVPHSHRFASGPCASNSPSLTSCMYVDAVTSSSSSNANIPSLLSPCSHMLFLHVHSDPYLADSSIGLPSSVRTVVDFNFLRTRLWQSVRLCACTELSLSTVHDNGVEVQYAPSWWCRNMT